MENLGGRLQAGPPLSPAQCLGDRLRLNGLRKCSVKINVTTYFS